MIKMVRRREIIVLIITVPMAILLTAAMLTIVSMMTSRVLWPCTASSVFLIILLSARHT